MVNLFDLQIPDVSVVPEPTAEDVKVFREFLHDPPPVVTFRVACYFARRCRELEERDHQAAEAYAAKCETQRYLEAEVERLKRMLVFKSDDGYDSLLKGQRVGPYPTEAEAWAAVRKAAIGK